MSWIVMGVVAGCAIAVYLWASDRLDRRWTWVDEQFEEERKAYAPPMVRVLPSVYDWAARDDFGDQAIWVWDRDEWERYP